MLKLHFSGDTAAVLPGVELLAESNALALSSDGLAVEVKQGGKGFAITETDGGVTITYERLCDFFRALSFVKQGVHSMAQASAFGDNGYMLDCSRNAVATVPAVKKLLRMMALMGLNTLQLYTEDTFEIPEWQYFGYQRGRYTQVELKELDGYAAQLGIELIPCVQTLAHLNAALHWQQFRDMVDCVDILLVDDDKTYRFIEDMMKQLAATFTTRKIHIGMDEAHMLGLGRYLDKHGYQNRSEIMCRHLQRVVDIGKQYGFKPMMWSDMFFRLAQGGDYYGGSDVPFPPEVLAMLPPEVTLVYWDYYHLKTEHYRGMLKTHQKFPNPIAFAGGAWKWGGLVPDLRFNMQTTRASLTACLDTGITDVFCCGWGDNGAECPGFTVLPALQLHAELGYHAAVTDEELAARFAVCTGGVWADFFLLDDPNNTTPTRDGTTNTSKPLLYQDVMLGLFDVHVDKDSFPMYFERTAVKLQEAASRNGEWAYLFDHMAILCRILSSKCTAGIDITAAYRSNDREALKQLADKRLPELCALVDELIYSFERVWRLENKPQGLEIIHIRLGGLRTRLEAAQRRIHAWLNGEIERMEELEVERLGFNGPIQPGEDINTHSNLWHAIVSACPVSG